MLNNISYQTNSFLAKTLKNKTLKKLNKEKFEKMIVFLAWNNVDATNNHVERNNRLFRMIQKTSYKRRKKHTIKKPLELVLYARMLKHPLYEHHFKQRHGPLHEEIILKMAA